MGALLCLLILAIERRTSWGLTCAMFAIFVLCAIQGAMTFSRTGPHLASSAAAAALLCFARDRFARVRSLVVVGMATLTFGLAWPILDQFTSGAIVERYEDVGTTGRLELARSDFAVFMQHPVLGVGPGFGSVARAEIAFDAAAHTEWTRALSEHGVFGLVSLIVLLTIIAGSIRSAGGPVEQGVALALVVWSVGFLATSAMRLSAPAFLIGLTCAMFKTGAHLRQRHVTTIPVRRLAT
jgi:hypothetical protein